MPIMTQEAAPASGAGTGAPPTAATVLAGVFAAATFLNAALLFALEPMFTKMVLPLLGGTPAVWNTCLMFFQVTLLGGYLYAHLTSRWLTTRTQGLVHLGALLVSLVFLPISIPVGVAPPPGLVAPVIWLVVLMFISLGLPFLLLAAGAPMLQRWAATTNHPIARNPYRLYVASNLGSFVSLLAYPFVVEPSLRLTQQRVVWAIAYVVLIGFVTVALLVALRLSRSAAPVGAGASEGAEAVVGTQEEAGPGGAESQVPRTIVPTAAWRLRWVLLAFAPSSLLLGVTNYLSTDVAAVPLLWVVPLALYLLTFIVVFAERPLLSRRVLLVLHVSVGLSLLILIATTPARMLTAFMLLHLLGFFVAAMVCHRELADARPRVEHLTEYYLWMSVGGALGGAFNVLVAPLMYDRILEYPLALIVAFGLRPARGQVDTSRASLFRDFAWPVLLYGGMLAAYQVDVPAGRWGTVMAYGLLMVGGVVVASFYRRPLRLAMGSAALFLAIDDRANDQSDVLFQERSFFGVYKVHRWGEYNALQHGTTTHGGQSVRAERRREPLTYYYRGGPLGDAFSELSDSTTIREVALVGLGTGTTSCYANERERWTYFEIDPVVVKIAMNPRLFSYMRDCAPNARVVLGDARLSMARARDASYDLIILDAFSSDAIPVHLMTREALALYLRKLKPDGVVLFHVSNRYLSLEPVLVELARDARLAGAVGAREVAEADRGKLYYGTRWVAMARRAERLSSLVTRREWQVLAPGADVRPWTDDYSDVLSVMRWR